ncbi:MAG: amidohydrolase [Oligoflexia bacterium]|nr:amidohydrolase [Oligoflexia bacterium]
MNTSLAPGPVDVHVHMLGTGAEGSGCFLRLTGHYAWLGRLIARDLGVPLSALREGLESALLPRVIKYITASRLSHVVLLAHELPHDDLGRAMPDLASFFVPNRYVLKLARQYPQILPGVAIHPARPDAMEELERCLEGGAALLKILPNCQNINCSEERFAPFWQRMAQAGLPLLAHTGGELSVPVLRKEYADPSYLRLPLECGVKVIAAHAGSRSLLWDRDYTNTFLDMLERYPTLYGDNSGMQTPLRSRYLRRLLEPAVMGRIVHGSDFPIPISGRWVAWQGMLAAADAKAASQIESPLERDLFIKERMGFSSQTFTRAWQVLRAKQP